MAKLYPPVIEGTIPAFNGTDLTVPFSMNRSVSIAQIGGFALKIKTIQSNTWLATVTSGQANTEYSAAEFRNITGSWTPVPGQFYKVQLAYIDSETREIGYFSTVGVVKYTEINKRNIQLQYQNTAMDDVAAIYPFTHSYAAAYDYSKDPMEKIYQYKFNIYDIDDIMLYTSDWQLHDATQDSAIYTSVDTYTFVNDLPENQVFKINYEAITVNGLHLTSSQYRVTMAKEMASQYQIALTAENNYDNGYVHLILKGSIEDVNGVPTEESISGQFKIYRRDLRDNKRWEPIITLHLRQQQPSTLTELKDFTVEHGVTYEYKICQVNNIGIVAICGNSKQVYVDFEDMFLFDGDHQLKVRFNPKVSSFKNDILESKMDTIGSQYPFFFRNGVVKYKEFPVSGLISYLMDNEELFMSLSELGLQDLEKVARNFTAPNPSFDEHGDRYRYNYSTVSTHMLWARKQLFIPVTRWRGNRDYYTYDAQRKRHEILDPPITPATRYERNPETGQMEPVEPTYADWDKAFQIEKQRLQLLAWEARLAEIGQTLPEDEDEIDEYLSQDKTVVLYLLNSYADWTLIPEDKQLEATEYYDWDYRDPTTLPAGALAHAAAVDGYNSVVNTKPKTTDLVNYNIAAERQFKLNVLEWLTNGQPKLFRSPAEGNYIVRLLNTSLTPTDSLGRMLHTFNSTAYEIDDLTYENLIAYGFIKSGTTYDLSQYPTDHRTILLYDLAMNIDNYQDQFIAGQDDDGDYFELLLHPTTRAAIIAFNPSTSGAQPGDTFIKIDELWITIGSEGTYTADGVSVRSIKFYPDRLSESTQPILEFDYYAGFTGASDLEAIVNLEYITVPMRQFVQDVIPVSTSKRSISNVAEANKNVIKKIEDVKTRLAQIYQLSFEKRPVETLYCDYIWDTYSNTPNAQSVFTKAEIVQHFSFNDDIDEWEEEYLDDGNSSKTLEMLKRMPIYVYELKTATQNTLTRGAGFLTSNDTITVYEKVLEADTLNANNSYYIMNTDDPVSFISVDYQDAQDPELLDILYIQKDVVLSEYELPTGEGRYCYIDGVRYDSTREIQNADISVPQPVNIYTRSAQPVEDNSELPPVYAVFDTARSQLQIVSELDTKVYINTGDRDELSAATKELFDLSHQTIDVNNALQPIVYYDIDNLTDIYIGDGVLMSMSYQLLITTYNIETHQTLFNLQRFYKQCQTDLENARKTFDALQLDPEAIDPGDEEASYYDPFTDRTWSQSRNEWVSYSYENYINAFLDYMSLWEEDNNLND